MSPPLHTIEAEPEEYAEVFKHLRARGKPDSTKPWLYTIIGGSGPILVKTFAKQQPTKGTIAIGVGSALLGHVVGQFSSLQVILPAPTIIKVIFYRIG